MSRPAPADASLIDSRTAAWRLLVTVLLVTLGNSDAVEDLTAVGRDTESQVLARAVKWHSEHRVLLNGHRTVVFR